MESQASSSRQLGMVSEGEQRGSWYWWSECLTLTVVARDKNTNMMTSHRSNYVQRTLPKEMKTCKPGGIWIRSVDDINVDFLGTVLCDNYTKCHPWGKTGWRLHRISASFLTIACGGTVISRYSVDFFKGVTIYLWNLKKKSLDLNGLWERSGLKRLFGLRGGS